MADDTRTTYTLTSPIQFGSETITALHFRPPRARDFKGLTLQSQTVDDTLVLAGRLSGQPSPVLDDLSVADLMGVSEIIAGFIPGGPQIGLKS